MAGNNQISFQRMDNKVIELCRKDFNTASGNAFASLYEDYTFADVTLFCEDKQLISAHKIILCSGSNFFRRLLFSNRLKHFLVIEANYEDLCLIVQFIYTGRCKVEQESLARFMRTAKQLQIYGLASDIIDNDDNKKMDVVLIQDSKTISQEYETIMNEEQETNIDSIECTLVPDGRNVHKQDNKELTVIVQDKIAEVAVESFTSTADIMEIEEPCRENRFEVLHYATMSNTDECVQDCNGVAETSLHASETNDRDEDKPNMINKDIQITSNIETYLDQEVDVISKHSQSKTYKCKVCEYQAVSRNYLISHNKLHSTVSFQCEECREEIWTKKALRQHYKIVHNKIRHSRSEMEQPNRKIKCDICGHKAPTNWFLYKHMASEHEYNINKCGICRKPFEKRTMLLIHKRDVHGKFYKCKANGCNFTSVYKRYLKNHNENIHLKMIYTFQCEECGKKLKNQKCFEHTL